MVNDKAQVTSAHQAIETLHCSHERSRLYKQRQERPGGGGIEMGTRGIVGWGGRGGGVRILAKEERHLEVGDSELRCRVF